jgi:hypothetical protein
LPRNQSHRSGIKSLQGRQEGEESFCIPGAFVVFKAIHRKGAKDAKKASLE